MLLQQERSAEIARHAGAASVPSTDGSGPRRLVEALFKERIDSVAALAEEALQAPDPWAGPVSFMEQMAELMAGDLCRDRRMFATYGQDRVAYARQRNAPLWSGWSRSPGGRPAPIRPPPDRPPVIVFLLAEATQLAASASPGIWRRYLR